MTPLGHAGISLLAGIGITKIAPGTDGLTILTGTAIGGTVLDLDLLYRFYRKRWKVFDKTIGKHRLFPTHTPLFALTLSGLIATAGILLSAPQLTIWSLFFIIGALIHLLLDTLFFPEGINFTYPFNRKTATLLTVKTHKFWAPKPISNVDGWYKNYFASPLFLISEVLPATISIVLLLRTLA